MKPKRRNSKVQETMASNSKLASGIGKKRTSCYLKTVMKNSEKIYKIPIWNKK